MTIRAEDLWSTEVEHAPTPLPLPMGNRVLVMHSKRNLNVSGRVQLVLLTANGELGLHGLSVPKHVEYLEGPFSKEQGYAIDHLR